MAVAPFDTAISVFGWQDGRITHEKHYAWKEQRDAFQTSQSYLDEGLIAWGKKNDYPERLIEEILCSPTARTIMNRTAGFIVGSKWKAEGPTPERSAMAEAKLKSIGVMRRALWTCGLDLARLQAMSWQVSRTEGQITGLDYLPVYRLRVAMTADKNPMTEATEYLISSDWRQLDGNLDPKKDEAKAAAPVRLPAYQKGAAAEHSVYYDFFRDTYADYYPIPEAESVRDSMKVEANTNAYQAAYTENGMSASGVVHHPFVPIYPATAEGTLDPRDQTRADGIIAGYQKQLTGARNAGQAMVVLFNPNMVDKNGNPIGKPTIEAPVQERNDKKFIEIQGDSKQSMFTALGVVSTELYGLSAGRGFSSQSDLLMTAFAVTESMVIEPKRQILTDFMDMVLDDLGFGDCKFVIESLVPVPVKHGVEYVRAGIITVNEARAELGFAELEQPITPPPTTPAQ